MSPDFLGGGRLQIMWQLQIYGCNDCATPRTELVGVLRGELAGNTSLTRDPLFRTLCAFQTLISSQRGSSARLGVICHETKEGSRIRRSCRKTGIKQRSGKITGARLRPWEGGQYYRYLNLLPGPILWRWSAQIYTSKIHSTWICHRSK